MCRRSKSSASPPTITYRFSWSPKRALQLVEEALVGLVRLLVGVRVEFLQQPSLLIAQVPRHEDVHEYALVAAAETLQHGHAPAAQLEDLTRLRARREFVLDVPVERGDGHGCTERRLGHRQVDRREDVVPLADEARIGAHVHLHVDVAGARAEKARVTLAAQANPLAVVDPRRDRYLEPSLLEHPAVAVADAARRLDLPAGPSAGRARLGADELAEDASGHLLKPSGASAGRARRDLASRLGPVAVAVRAGDRDLERHLAARAGGGVDEVDLDGGGEIGAARSRSSSAEDVLAEERGEEIGQAAEIEVAGLVSAAAKARVAVAVVELAGLGFREHLVGLDDLAEALLCVRGVRDVRMQLARKPAKCLLDVCLARVARDAEELVVVALGRCHGLVEASARRRSTRRSARARTRRSGRHRAPSRSPSAPAR